MLLEHDSETDAAGVKARVAGHAQLRRCIATRVSLPRERLVRFVVGPDQVVVHRAAEVSVA